MTTKAAKLMTVKEIMSTDPIAVEPTTTAHELARILTDNSISGVPVVDVQDRVVGVVSKTDLLQWCVTGGLGFGADDLLDSLGGKRGRKQPKDDDLGIVEDFMSSEPILASTDEPVESIAKRMADERVHRIVVVDDDGCLLGIVTSLDLLKVFPRQ